MIIPEDLVLTYLLLCCHKQQNYVKEKKNSQMVIHYCSELDCIIGGLWVLVHESP